MRSGQKFNFDFVCFGNLILQDSLRCAFRKEEFCSATNHIYIKRLEKSSKKKENQSTNHYDTSKLSTYALLLS